MLHLATAAPEINDGRIVSLGSIEPFAIPRSFAVWFRVINSRRIEASGRGRMPEKALGEVLFTFGYGQFAIRNN
jgi:hypothetical protein